MADDTIIRIFKIITQHEGKSFQKSSEKERGKEKGKKGHEEKKSDGEKISFL